MERTGYLFLGGNNNLYAPSTSNYNQYPKYIQNDLNDNTYYYPAFHAHFYINGGISSASRLVMNFGDGDDGQTGIVNVPTDYKDFPDGWYTLNGVRLGAKPTKSGIYMNNGRKVVVK